MPAVQAHQPFKSGAPLGATSFSRASPRHDTRSLTSAGNGPAHRGTMLRWSCCQLWRQRGLGCNAQRACMPCAPCSPQQPTQPAQRRAAPAGCPPVPTCHLRLEELHRRAEHAGKVKLAVGGCAAGARRHGRCVGRHQRRLQAGAEAAAAAEAQAALLGRPGLELEAWGAGGACGGGAGCEGVAGNQREGGQGRSGRAPGVQGTCLGQTHAGGQTH